jgi:hypothetical protein
MHVDVALLQGANLPLDDLEALMTGIYASPVGCLCTCARSMQHARAGAPTLHGVSSAVVTARFDNEVVPTQRVAQIATTVARPGRGYGGTYNYFDPDNFISLSAMIYSGDEYLQLQARGRAFWYHRPPCRLASLCSCACRLLQRFACTCLCAASCGVRGCTP